MKSLAIGTVFGMALGVMLVPELDRKTQRAIRKNNKRLRYAARDAYDNVYDYIR